MNLLLTSTGLSSSIAPFFLKLIKSPPQNFPLAFIPTAADPYEDKWFLTKDIQDLNRLGFPVSMVDLKSDPDLIHFQLKKSRIIFVGGGNTFYLLHWMRISGVNSYLPQLLKNSRFYIGASAGSIVTGPDIAISGWDPSWDTNDIHLTDTTGLNLVPFVVSPHFTPSHQPIIKAKSKQVNYQVIPITDNQAVYFNGLSYEIIDGK